MAGIGKLRSEEGKILYLGEQYSFVLKPEMNKAYKIDTDNKVIYAGKNLLDNIDYRKSFYKRQANIVLKQQGYMLAEKHNVKVEKFSVKQMRSSWGNCSITHSISINEFLILAPLEVIESLICHELAHTFQFNHSSKFYEKWESLFPNYRACRNFLKEKVPLKYE